MRVACGGPKLTGRDPKVTTVNIFKKQEEIEQITPGPPKARVWHPWPPVHRAVPPDVHLEWACDVCVWSELCPGLGVALRPQGGLGPGAPLKLWPAVWNSVP